MSADSVDDVHAAEDFAIELHCMLRRVVDAFPAGVRGETRLDRLTQAVMLRQARNLITQGDTYCRPTCRYLEEGECHDGDSCGCPCGHPHVHGPTCPRDSEGPTVMWLCGHEPHSTPISPGQPAGG